MRFVAVVTYFFDLSDILQAFANVDDNAPSLAVLLLPCRLPPTLPEHTFYLPLISPSSLDFGSTASIVSSAFSEQVTVDSAHYTWKKLDLPKENVIVLDKERPEAILDVSALENTQKQTALAEAFSVIFASSSDDFEIPRHHEQLTTNKW